LSQRFTVFIDDREAASPVTAALMRMPDIRVQVQRLAVGDYQVDDALLFERKTLRLR
jgi:ERCC4-type nuclease